MSSILKAPKARIRYSNFPENVEKSHNFHKTERVSVMSVLKNHQKGQENQASLTSFSTVNIFCKKVFILRAKSVAQVQLASMKAGG